MLDTLRRWWHLIPRPIRFWLQAKTLYALLIMFSGGVLFGAWVALVAFDAVFGVVINLLFCPHCGH